MSEVEQLPDLTDYDFQQASLYKSKPSEGLFVEELVEDEVIVRSWGVQDMKKGDFVTYKPSAAGIRRSGIRREAFLATYEPAEKLSYYRKNSYIKAARIDYDFQFMGIDSDRPEVAKAGSYLVLNLDRDKNPIFVSGRRDIYFYSEADLLRNYDQV